MSKLKQARLNSFFPARSRDAQPTEAPVSLIPSFVEASVATTVSAAIPEPQQTTKWEKQTILDLFLTTIRSLTMLRDIDF